jgi:hypothetical protein
MRGRRAAFVAVLVKAAVTATAKRRAGAASWPQFGDHVLGSAGMGTGGSPQTIGLFMVNIRLTMMENS